MNIAKRVLLKLNLNTFVDKSVREWQINEGRKIVVSNYMEGLRGKDIKQGRSKLVKERLGSQRRNRSKEWGCGF